MRSWVKTSMIVDPLDVLLSICTRVGTPGTRTRRWLPICHDATECGRLGAGILAATAIKDCSICLSRSGGDSPAKSGSCTQNRSSTNSSGKVWICAERICRPRLLNAPVRR